MRSALLILVMILLNLERRLPRSIFPSSLSSSLTTAVMSFVSFADTCKRWTMAGVTFTWKFRGSDTSSGFGAEVRSKMNFFMVRLLDILSQACRPRPFPVKVNGN